MTLDEQAAKPVQRVIGLTGGIGMGKTTVSNYLATVHHLPVLDADVFAHQAVEPDTPILAAIADRYGNGILRTTGHLDRHRLGDIIFNSPSERLWLEQQIHPFVRDRLVTALKTPPLQDVVQNPIVVLVVPLLFEARMTDLVTETWVIKCSAEQQLQRLLARDRLTLEQVQARINSQMAIAKKTARANVVLENDTTQEFLFQQIDHALMQQERDRSKSHASAD
jgi:dephospho-CoA kinase